ncbi:oxidoreductase [Acidocella sp.]|uniref:oxidoreductase n=1 Tax=Acidocella sp. TaxID=50710 RepID=UPI00184B7C19|nr:oxidoreductase [Acidocella sp.]NNM58099.1 SDR family oxidoreductase [Acidocella sp.]
MNAWASGDIPSQAGKLAVITGANSGIGYFTALQLAKAGANVILACRNAEKGAAAAAKINAAAPGRAVFEALDLARLASVHDFAARFKAAHGTLDILINNAGVMATPARQTTADGFELQFGVNFLGHFALTTLLLPALMKAPAPRVIQLSSIAHRQGRIDLTDLQSARAYKPWQAYSQSKLAMLMFALELQRRADAGGWGLLSLAAHPGIARTELIANGPGAGSLTALGLKLVEPFISQSGEAGALPTLFAATTADVPPGGYYGPTGFREFRGPPGKARPEKHALDAGVARALWEAAEALTGLRVA